MLPCVLWPSPISTLTRGSHFRVALSVKLALITESGKSYNLPLLNGTPFLRAEISSLMLDGINLNRLDVSDDDILPPLMLSTAVARSVV